MEKTVKYNIANIHGKLKHKILIIWYVSTDPNNITHSLMLDSFSTLYTADGKGQKKKRNPFIKLSSYTTLYINDCR